MGTLDCTGMQGGGGNCGIHAEMLDAIAKNPAVCKSDKWP